MNWFRYAQDYYGDWLPQQVFPRLAMLAIAAVVAFIGIHLLRRCRGDPNSAADGEVVEKYQPGARLYHWGSALLMAGLVLSGAALLVPGTLKQQMIPWVRAHEILAALFISAVVVHAVIAPWHGDRRSMWFERRDARDLRTIARNFFGRTREYPVFGKYDPLQKLYHAFLALASLAVIVTGVVLFLSTEALVTFSHESLRWMRLIHDLTSVAFVAAVLGHIYFAVIPANRPELRAMFTGRMRRQAAPAHPRAMEKTHGR